MNSAALVLKSVRDYRWMILLFGILGLLLISPFSSVYDRNDNIISPLTAIVVAAVTLGTVRSFVGLAVMAALTVLWLIISLVTDGSGLFAGVAVAAPALFLVVVGSVFLLLANWLAHIRAVNMEVLCAAICGYLIVGIFWAGVYALILYFDGHAIISTDEKRVEQSDLLYFSYSTLTTTGFGDLVPKNPGARMCAVMEAVFGTFYNAIIIARLVTLYGFKTPEQP
jgi:voltage-gated potassium channel